jgi:hypothetical protein
MTTKINMTTDEVLQKIESGGYQVKEVPLTLKKLRDTHVENADKSVNWNKQFVLDNNDAYKAQVKARREAGAVLSNLQNTDAINAIAFEYDLTEKEASRIFSYLYSEHHSYGLREIFSHASEFIDVIKDIKQMNGL